MPNNNSTIEISTEMEEIVGNIPPWIVRWGISGLFIVSLLGISISRLISYPDTLNTKVLIQAANQPGKVTISRTSANVAFKFLVKDGEQVIPGDTLLIKYDKTTGKSTPIVTPMTGEIYISNGLNAKNTLDKIIWVVPKSSKVTVKIYYDNKGAGNVKVGQTVKMELYDFPANEYGFIKGQISSILPVQVNEKHQAYVELPDKKLITSEDIEIPISPVMQGSGEILLNSRSIFQRIFGSIFR